MDNTEAKYTEDKNPRDLSQGLISLVYIVVALLNFYFDRGNLGYFYAASSLFWFYRGTEEIYELYYNKTGKKALFIGFSFFAGLVFLFKFYMMIH
ncbi:MAG: hypothetical protein GX046_04595 [Tissierellia bacterium]|jgi:hypothetical protein|nr:hypothetical protein [Tissierellia bacterium]